MRFLRLSLFTGIFTLLISTAAFGQQAGSLTGQVVDALGSIVVGASVTAVSADGKEKIATTNQRGEFTINGLAPGKYTVKAIAPKFALYENTEVEIAAGAREEISIILIVEALSEQVEVSNENRVTTDADNNAGATVLKDKDLDALPDDPDELEAALQALAGPSAGPNGGQIYIDGFTGGRLPPKESIREIRINQNPFSAEYERLGFGRVEILTRPGSDKWRGQAFLNFNDESLNSRNPFALNRAPSQMRFFGGSISGPVQKGKSSFFLDINNRHIDNNTVVNALVLDPAFNIIPFQQDIQVPSRRFSFSPRFDYQLNTNNTLVARYSFGRATSENQGIGDTSLPSRASQSTNTEHEFRLTETMIVNPTTINETRFQYSFNKREQLGDNSIPTISVPSAFLGGGAQVGLSFNHSKSWEILNNTTTAWGKNSQHGIKFGIRFRGINIDDRSENNFGGTFTFPGIAEVRNPVGCTLGSPGCTVVSPAVSSIEQYRQRVLGNPDPRYNPSQFSITTGNPLAGVSQVDMGIFFSDDWRVSQALTLSFGLRYENQTNINDDMNFAPRVSFAWSPGAGGARAPKTVFRGGAGFFYDRFNENFTLQTERFDGVNQLNLLVSAFDSDPARQAIQRALLAQPVFTINGVTNVPTAAQIRAVLPASSTIRLVDSELRSPLTMQVAFGMERQLPAKTTLAMFYIGSRIVNQLRTRNINAPVCATPLNCVGAVRPDTTRGNIFEYESTGTMTQNQLITNFRTMLSANFTLFGNYRLGFARGDTDGANTFPAYMYDLSDETGRSAFDIRHSFVIGGNFNLPWGGISLSPFIIANSGRPFNITRGVDSNLDTLYTERPTFAELGARCTALGLTTTYCDVAGQNPNDIIPRNFGDGPGFFSVNLRVGKNFGFGGPDTKAQAAQGGQQGGGAGGGGNRGGGNRGGGAPGGGGGGVRVAGPGGMGGMGGGNEVRKPYNLNIGLNFNNLLNTVNFNNPVGSLTSSRFGQSTSTSGGFGGFGGGGGGGTANRRVELQMRFSW